MTVTRCSAYAYVHAESKEDVLEIVLISKY